MKVRESWVQVRDDLATFGVADASIEAETIVRHGLSLDRTQFFAELDRQIGTDEMASINELAARRKVGEPLAYILGNREFYGLEMYVNKHVLVPRQETELLVDKVLDFAERRAGESMTIADVGTGSGAIAVALASRLPQATVYATDSSEAALAVADVNRRRHDVADRVHLCHGDLLSVLPGPVDAIVSNPPYVAAGELPGLPPDVRREPRAALDGGHDGLRVTERLLMEATAHLNERGQALVEIAPQQLESVVAVAQQAFPSATVGFDRDLLGLPRVVVVKTGQSSETATGAPISADR